MKDHIQDRIDELQELQVTLETRAQARPLSFFEMNAYRNIHVELDKLLPLRNNSSNTSKIGEKEE